LDIAALDDSIELKTTVLVDGRESFQAKTASDAVADSVLRSHGDGRGRDGKLDFVVLRLGDAGGWSGDVCHGGIEPCTYPFCVVVYQGASAVTVDSQRSSKKRKGL